MEDGAMEELDIHSMLASQMGTNFSFANPQQAFPGSMELLKSSDIWIGVTVATNHTISSKEGTKNVKESSITTHEITGDVVRPDKEIDIECDHYPMINLEMLKSWV